MKTKDGLARERFGVDFKDLCKNRKRTIDALFVLEEEKEHEKTGN